MVKKQHEEDKKVAADILRGVPSMAFTTDAWTSKATKSYATHTAYYLTDDLKVQSLVPQTSLFHGSHTEVNLLGSA